MTRKFLLALVSLFLTFCSAAGSMGGTITYDFVSYAALQNGYTLSGTITTDGSLGPLSSADITAWNYTITNGTITDEESGAGAETQGLTASSTQLTLPQSTAPLGYSYLALNGGPPNSDYRSQLFYAYLVPWPVNPSLFVDIYQSIIPQGPTPPGFYGWEDDAFDPPGLSLGGSPWIIAQAAVPEPDSVTLALVGSACLAAAQWTRRRRRVPNSSHVSPTADSCESGQDN